MAKARGKSKPRAPTVFLREAAPKDLDELYRLSEHLNSVNFPRDKGALRKILQTSRASFAQKLEDPLRREYLFVLEDLNDGSLAGTSMLIAQHGHPECPHIYFDVIPDERYSSTLDRHFHHTSLRLGFEYRGPTEVGGLVLDPKLRGHGLGKQLSFVRFLFIAMYRHRFRDDVLAELMPPLLDDGRSPLWEFLGRKFTGLGYQEADKLSQDNKEFITALFPYVPINASLLPDHVQELIGEVGDETKGVERMLRSVGFEYCNRIDPFDGGPHYDVRTDDITLVKGARPCRLSRTELGDEPPGPTQRVMIGKGDESGACRFRATTTEAFFVGAAEVRIPAQIKKRLKLKPGQTVWTMPY